MAKAEQLSMREKEVVDLLMQGKSNKAMALELGISVRTVEFHLKNVYAKYQVGTRVELVLRLRSLDRLDAGDARLGTHLDELDVNHVDSTVAGGGERWQDGGAGVSSGSRREAAPYIRHEEFKMKNMLRTRHIPAGILAAVLTGLGWMALMIRFGHMRVEEIAPWALPILLTLGLIGAVVGFFGRRYGRGLMSVILGAIMGTGLSPLTILPIMGFIVLPLGKLASAMGIIDREAISMQATESIAITAMLVVWLIVGAGIGRAAIHLRIVRGAGMRRLEARAEGD